jgi:hypothetical protein
VHPFPRIQPQAELRQMNAGAGKFKRQRHGQSVGCDSPESNPRE